MSGYITVLREQIKTGYFEDLIQKYLLDNAHGAVVVVAPEKGLNRAKEQALAENLQHIRPD